MGEKPNPIGFGAPNPTIVGEKSSPNPNPLDPKPTDIEARESQFRQGFFLLIPDIRPETEPLPSLDSSGWLAADRRPVALGPAVLAHPNRLKVVIESAEKFSLLRP